MWMSKFDKQTVTGLLKQNALTPGGACDKDIIYANKTMLIKVVGGHKLLGTLAMVCGGLATITVFGAIIGIPLLIFGWWARKRTVNNIQTIEAAYADFVVEL